MFGSRGFRLTALFAALVAVFTLAAVDMAEARTGGNFGSRGTRTYQSIPATPTSPTVTGPVQRSMTQPGATSTNPGYFGSGYNRGGFFGGLGGWLLGGLMFSGLFGMMFGGGFGGFGGVFSLLIQLLLIGLVLRWVFRRFGNAQPAGPSYGGATSFGYAAQSQPGGSSAGAGGFGFGGAPRSDASRRAGGRDEIGISNQDLDVFEQRLIQLQDSYSREDFDALRRIVTPEVMSYLNEELAQFAAKGLRNEVFDVRLLSGDIAEAWREGTSDYATVSLRYESRDVMRERATGKLVSGADQIEQRTEVWTFVRVNRGDWLVSAIQT